MDIRIKVYASCCIIEVVTKADLTRHFRILDQKIQNLRNFVLDGLPDWHRWLLFLAVLHMVVTMSGNLM
jgi:hypothetical protein